MADKEYLYYPGCSQEGSARDYDLSLKVVLRALGVGLKEVEDWSCCGSTPAHTVDHLLAAALGARNLALVEAAGSDTVTTPCPSCLAVLKRAHHAMAADGAFRDEVNELLDEPYQGSVMPKSTLQVLYEDVGLEAVTARVTHALPDIRVAPYYGCILNRPPDIARFDDPENPVAMDRLLAAAGLQVVDFAFKVECCGAAFGVPKREMVNRLTHKVLAMALDAGANCLAVVCPLCQQNLDLRQGQVNTAMGTNFAIPVLYFSQIIGLTYGYSPKELGIDKCIVSADQLIASRGPKVEKAPEEPAPKKKAAAKKAEAEGAEPAKETA